MNLRLSIALTNNPRTQPIHASIAKPDGVDLVISTVHPSEMFWRQLRFGDFDISEMSFSSYLMALAAGDTRWVGLPIFTSRKFFHTGVLVRKDAGIERPEDLKGRRVGVPEYQQTAALWTRGVIQDEFGVRPQDMEFWMERNPDHSHGGATGFKPPEGVTIHQIPEEKNIGSMMLSGELEATLLYIVDPNLVDRSTADLWNHPDIRYLFPDPHAEGIRFYQKTGVFPVNHAMVIRRSIYESDPWVVLNLLKAFEQAKQYSTARRREQAEPHYETGSLSKEAFAAMSTDLFPYGVKANRKTLEMAARFSHQQGLTPRLMQLDEVFAANTLDQ